MLARAATLAELGWLTGRTRRALAQPASAWHSQDGLQGRLNPIPDTHARAHLYADNIAIDLGRRQPVHFRMETSLRLTSAYGAEVSFPTLGIVGESSLLEYRRLET